MNTPLQGINQKLINEKKIIIIRVRNEKIYIRKSSLIQYTSLKTRDDHLNGSKCIVLLRYIQSSYVDYILWQYINIASKVVILRTLSQDPDAITIFSCNDLLTFLPRKGVTRVVLLYCILFYFSGCIYNFMISV